MPDVSVDQLRERLGMMDARKAHYESQSAAAGGMLKRHELWRHDYLSYPYLIGAPDNRLAERFRAVFINQTELGHDGTLGLLPVDVENSFMLKFTHVMEDYAFRGGTPIDVVRVAREPILRYFANGDPIAVKMFAGYVAPSSPFLVKYGRRQFLEPMLREGRMRICPAGFYNNQALIEAIQDNEISKTFFIPTFRERLAGQHVLDFQGHRIPFGNDDIVMPVVAPDYYLFSLCDHIYYRLPTDFDADAALIIRDPIRFSQRMISAFLALWPDWDPLYGPVTYYDPYRDYTKVRIPQMSKHFGYSYQREVRIAFRAKQQLRTELQPEYLTIGSMTDCAELVSA